MALSEPELEEYISQEVAKELNNIDVPNIDEQWTKFKKQLQSEQDISKRKVHLYKSNYKKITWVAVIIIIIGCTMLIKPINTEAFGEKFVQLYNYVVGKTTKNQTRNYQHPPNSNVPVIQDRGTTVEKEVSLEEAQSMVSYKLALPTYLPKNTKEQQILVSSIGDNTQKITIIYTLNGNSLVLEERNAGRAASSGILYDTDDTVNKDITINGYTGTLFTNKNGFNKVNWEIRGVVLQLSGKVVEEEIIKIANSIN
ncbi:DUF4367 domain-containing protein [Desulfitobacterium sp. Sab5]|uniref:DUF4367 domain-containing protein n=1 Tax=Desulfitobacterium nosdiversum TaxID=3375356 RepID=UPI003CF114B0